MKSGVYYLYEYKHDQKSRNVGFVKFTHQPDSYFLQICTRGIPVFHGDSASLSILYATEEVLHALHCQTIKCENHAITCKLTFSSSDFKPANLSMSGFEPSIFGHSNLEPSNLEASGFEPSNLEASARRASDFQNLVCGFLIELPDQTRLVAMEDGISFSPEKCRTPSKKISNTVEAHDKEAPPQKTKSEEPCVSLTKSTAIAKEESCIPPTTTTTATAECSIPSTTNTVAAQHSIRKIQRSELSVLPRRYWNISNNRFLLHGYYNYNHLLLVEEKNYFLVGVPGIYDKREARAADLFGFPTFSESYTKSLDLSSEETSEQGQFGYWCKKIPTKTE